jgi:LPS export ABC transporter protein LptC
MGKGWRWIAGIAVVGIAAGGIRACQVIQERELAAQQAANEADPSEPGLTLRDVTLEQSDDDGNLLWRIKAVSVTYSPDREIAVLEEPDGELYQDGEIIYRVSAQAGEVLENGQVVLLQDNIVATGEENEVVLRGNQLEWRPSEDLMTISDGITGNNPQVDATAESAQVFTREQRVELIGEVLANTIAEAEGEPTLKLQATDMTWWIEEERLASETPLRIEQIEAGQVTDWVAGDTGEFDLATEVATLRQNVQMTANDQSLQVASEELVWNVPQAEVTLPQPVRIIDAEQGVTVIARRGTMDLDRQVVVLREQVQATGRNDGSELRSDVLTWTVDTQEIVAEGNVDYRQADPPVTVRGPRAVGRLEAQTVVISGGRVVTEIVPNF